MNIVPAGTWLILAIDFALAEERFSEITAYDSSENLYPLEEKGQLASPLRGWISKVGEVASKVEKSVSKILQLVNTKGRDGGKGSHTSAKPEMKLIFPGTRYCGQDNIAEDPDELGRFNETDNCCKQHDNCPQYISPGKIKYGLYNTGLFTRSLCDCDSRFYSCLQNVNNIIAKNIGVTYFTVLGPQCFKWEYPIIGCKKTKWKRCIDYDLDSMQRKRMQWFDNPIFTV